MISKAGGLILKGRVLKLTPHPQLVLELGSYVGFSGISFGRVSRQLPQESGSDVKASLTLQNILDMHPDAIYPANWTSNTSEDRAGYISLEKSDVYAATAQGAFDLAGLGEVMKVRSGDHLQRTLTST